MGALSKHRKPHSRPPTWNLNKPSLRNLSSANAISTFVIFSCTWLTVRPVVDLQSTGRRVIKYNDKQDVLSAQFCRRNRACCTVREQDYSTAPSLMCSSRVDFCKGNVLICAFDRRKHPKDIEPILQNVDRHRSYVIDETRIEPPKKNHKSIPDCRNVQRID